MAGNSGDRIQLPEQRHWHVYDPDYFRGSPLGLYIGETRTRKMAGVVKATCLHPALPRGCTGASSRYEGVLVWPTLIQRIWILTRWDLKNHALHGSRHSLVAGNKLPHPDPARSNGAMLPWQGWLAAELEPPSYCSKLHQECTVFQIPLTYIPWPQ